MGHRSLDEQVFYTFSFPITAGPGTLVVHAHAEGARNSRKFLRHGFGSSGHHGRGCSAVYRRLLQLCLRACAHGKSFPADDSWCGARDSFILLWIGAHIAWNGLQPLLRTVLH
jgi:multiple antibiotic resistance protein